MRTTTIRARVTPATAHVLAAMCALFASHAVAQELSTRADGLFLTNARERTPILAAESHARPLDNDATRFQLHLRFARTAAGCDDGTLHLRDRVVRSESRGSDASSCTISFELDRADAIEAARRLGIRRIERREVGQRLIATFETNGSTFSARGDRRVRVTVKLALPADATPVWFVRGGRNRGPRDNQFSFRATRDGAPVTPREAMDFGGLMQRVAIAPGEMVAIDVPLELWFDLRLPGHWVIECGYETELGDEQTDPLGAWDRTFRGRVELNVEPQGDPN